MASPMHENSSLNSEQDQPVSIADTHFSDNSAERNRQALSDSATEHINDTPESEVSIQGSTIESSVQNIIQTPVSALESTLPTEIEVHNLESLAQNSLNTSQQDIHSQQNGPGSRNYTAAQVDQHNTTSASVQSPTPSVIAIVAQNSSNNTTVHDFIVPIQASIFTNPAPGTSSAAQTRVLPEDENVLKYFIMLRPTGPAAKVLSKVCRDLYLGGEDTVKEYCINSLGLRNTDYRKVFTSHERQILDAGTNWDTLDITFLYKLLQRVCGLAPPSDKKWVNPDPQDIDGIEHNLYLIKAERNFLAHETVTLTDLQLEQRSQRLKTLLTNVLNRTALRTNTDISQDVANMHNAIDETLLATSSLSLEVYQQELEDMRYKIVNRVVKESRCELFEYYLHLWSSSTVSWSQTMTVNEGYDAPTMEQVFTNITITERNGNEVMLHEMFGYCMANGSLPRLLIIEGIAGIGKSHICKYVLYKWASQKADEVSLHDADVVIFIQCHSVNSSTLREFLCEVLLPRSCHGLRHEDVIPALKNCEVMFIIDGLDEASTKAKGIIREINTKFQSSRILITCRPEFTEEAKLLMTENKNFTVFYVKGFNGPQRKDYVRKLFTLMCTEENDIDTLPEAFYSKLEEMEQHLYSLLRLPLTMMLLVFLLLEDSESLSLTGSVTQIFQQMVDMRIKQVAERLHRKPNETRHMSLIERTCNQWLQDLTKVAWESLSQNTQILDEKCTSVLLDKALDYNIDPMDIMSSFLKYKMFGTKYVWEFFHKAFQEYLSASYLSSTTIEEARESYKILYRESFRDQPLGKKLTDHIYITSSEYERLQTATYRARKINCLSMLFNCFQNIFCCKISNKLSKVTSKKRSNAFNQHTMQGCTFSMDLSSYSYSAGESVPCRLDKSEGEILIEGQCWSPSRSRSKSLSRSRSTSMSRDEKLFDAESPYEIGISLDDDTQKKVALQNTLQFLGAMEASKQEVDHERLKDIVEKFYQSSSLPRWSAWASLIRECQGHPLVCQFVQPYLNGQEICGWDAHYGMAEYLETIEYLLKKTQFTPGKTSLWMKDDTSVPAILGSVLSLLGEVSPTLVIELKCLPEHCSRLQQSLLQTKRLDLVDLTIHGTLKEYQLNEFVSLMKYLNEKEVEFKMELIIDATEDLIVFADCCKLGGLPNKTKLELFVRVISDEMFSLLCQILSAFSWVKEFTFAFTDADLFVEINHIQRLLIKTLEHISIQLTKVELTVDADAQNRIESYEDMAQAIAGEIPVAVTFNDWADGDHIRLILQGIK